MKAYPSNGLVKGNELLSEFLGPLRLLLPEFALLLGGAASGVAWHVSLPCASLPLAESLDSEV